jgi:hypothetical protein
VLSGFVTDRISSYHKEAEKYYNSLKKDDWKAQFTQSIYSLFIRHTYDYNVGVDQVGDFIDLSLCYRKTESELVPLSQAASQALLRFYASHNPFCLYTAVQSVLMKPSGDEFERMVWSLLIRDTVLHGNKLMVQPYYLNGEPAPKMELSFQCFDSLDKERSVPESYKSHSVLFRPWKGFPRWDFVSSTCFFQVSISAFSDHNKDSATIDKSFGECDENRKHDDTGDKQTFPNNKEIFSLITGQDGYTSTIDKGNLIVLKNGVPQQISFFYLTLDQPRHPILFNKYRNLLVLSAREIWGKA